MPQTVFGPPRPPHLHIPPPTNIHQPKFHSQQAIADHINTAAVLCLASNEPSLVQRLGSLSKSIKPNSIALASALQYRNFMHTGHDAHFNDGAKHIRSTVLAVTSKVMHGDGGRKSVALGSLQVAI